MKPTDKQVVEWARKAQVANAWDINWFDPYYANFAALAYEAGRKDENEACAKVCEAEGKRVDASWVSCAFAIRERGAP